MTDRILMSGKKKISTGDTIELRLIQSECGQLRADRPLRDRPLKIKVKNAGPPPVPENTGTYQLTGTVYSAMYGERENPDYLFLESEWQLNQIARSVERLDSSEFKSSDEISPGDYTDTTVDFDIESLPRVEFTESQSANR